MHRRGRWLLVLGVCLLLLPRFQVEGADKVWLSEEFSSLDNWDPFYFPKIKEHSTYSIVQNDLLKTESHASASALIFKQEFNVYQFPLVEWRWKVENVYMKGDAKTKQGDDYPLRIYIIFKYDPKKAGFRKRMKYKTVKAMHGKYPPHSMLNYIWANKEYSEEILTNKFRSEAKMFLLQKGRANVGRWQVEKINIVDDYRRAFGEDPPAIARISIMNDSDNTKEHAISYLDYLKIFQADSL